MVFSDFIIFTKFVYVKWHLILISISLTANVVEYLFNGLITVQISLYVNSSFMFFMVLLHFLSFSYLFVGIPCDINTKGINLLVCLIIANIFSQGVTC